MAAGKDKAFEAKDAASKALEATSRPLPRAATTQDIVQLRAAIARFQELGLHEVEAPKAPKSAKPVAPGKERLAKAERTLELWEEEAARTEAVSYLHQAFHRLDRDADGKLIKAEWEKLKECMDSSEWSPKTLDELWTNIDRNKNGTIEYEEFVEYLMNGHRDGHKLVREITETAPNREDGLAGLFGRRLLAGSYQVDFEVSTMEALEGVDIIGIVFMTSSSVDQTLYPATIMKENLELKERLVHFRHVILGDEDQGWPGAEQNFEVVFCSFDTREDAFMKTIGTPPWLVMPWDSPWERDHLWRKFNHLWKHKADPCLVIMKPNGEVISTTGFADIEVRDKFMLGVFDTWCNPPPPPAPEDEEEDEDED